MATTRLQVQLATAQHFAAPFNNQPADLLVLVADAVSGQPVAGLPKSRFTVVSHFAVPGASSGFTNTFVINNVGTGAYHLRVKPKTGNWVHGEYLVEVTVKTPTGRGQAAGVVSIS